MKLKILIDESIITTEFFRLLSEYSQRKVSASELTKAVEELAIHVANFSINEQDYSVLLRYFSFGLYRLKSYRVRFEQEKMPYLHLIDEAIGLLNTEIRLIEWRIKYPEQLKQRIENKAFPITAFPQKSGISISNTMLRTTRYFVGWLQYFQSHGKFLAANNPLAELASNIHVLKIVHLL